MHCTESEEDESCRPPTVGEECDNKAHYKHTAANTTGADDTEHGDDGVDPEQISTHFCSETGTPPYRRWALSLKDLLSDPDGVQIFREYLGAENSENLVKFWFTCKWLKETGETERIPGIVKTIYSTFISKTGEETFSSKIDRGIRKQIADAIRVKKVVNDRLIFAGVEAEVEKILQTEFYPAFLESNIYLNHVQSVQSQSLSSGSSFGSAGSVGKNSLPTLHEEQDAVPSSSYTTVSKDKDTAAVVSSGSDSIALATIEKLLQSRLHLVDLEQADVPQFGLQSECSQTSLCPIPPATSLESDLHSSEVWNVDYDCPLNDSVETASVASASSVRKKELHHHQHFSEKPHQCVRTHQKRQPSHEAFAKMLYERLVTEQQRQQTEIERNRQMQIQLDQKIQPTAFVHDKIQQALKRLQQTSTSSGTRRHSAPCEISTVCEEDSSDESQAILDKHISKCFGKSPENSPTELPPVAKYRKSSEELHVPQPLSKGRKEHGSMLSTDSGMSNEGTHEELHNHIHHHHYYFHNVSRLKTQGNEDFTRNLSDYTGAGSTGHSGRSHGISDKRGSSKRHTPRHSSCPLTASSSSFFDSGISLYESASSLPTAGADVAVAGEGQNLVDYGKLFEKPVLDPDTAAFYYHVQTAGQDSSRHSSHHNAGLKTGHGRHCPATTRPSSRSAGRSILPDKLSSPKTDLSTSRNSKKSEQHAQDLSMPSKTEVEEVQRRSLAPSPSLAPGKSRSSKRKEKKSTPSTSPQGTTTSSSTSDSIIVGYELNGETYKIRLTGKNITLRHFKSSINKKPHYRYFFKRESDEFGTGIIYEEIYDDETVLPLWQGKIFAKLESTN